MEDEAVIPDGNPQTFEEAFAADAASASDPAPESTAPTGAVSPEAQAAVPATTGDDDRSPFIPRARFDEVNTKLNELKQWRESRAFAENVSPEQFQTMTSWFARAVQDPNGFALGLLDELSQSPQHSQAIRSELARRLGTRQGKETTDGPPAPDVDITDAAGNIVGRGFSDTAVLKLMEHARRQIAQEVDAKYAPHLQTLGEIEKERRSLAEQREATARADEFMGELKTLPMFDENKRAIGEMLKTMRLASDHPDAVKAAAYSAYLKVVTPKLQNGTKQAVVADLQRKAHASTSVNPASAAPSTPKSPASFFDPALEW